MTNFGRDVLCVGSLRTGRYAVGVAVVAQRFLHALTTPRGAVMGDEHHANWGDDLLDCVGLPGGVEAETAIRAKINRAASNDEAIAGVVTRVVSSQASDGTWMHGVYVDAQTAEGPFQIVIEDIADVTTARIGVAA